jgi:tellurite resistance protein TerC
VVLSGVQRLCSGTAGAGHGRISSDRQTGVVPRSGWLERRLGLGGLAFNFAFYRYALWTFALDARLLQTPDFSPEAVARQIGLQFLSGYLVEKALSLDNIFVFVVVFSFFGIPAIYHRRVLFYGILGALVFRGIFIAAGSALLQYHWIMGVFGAFLVLTGVKMMLVPDRPIEPEKNPVSRSTSRRSYWFSCLLK